MPGKNKQQKNAFYFYMQDLMPELKREGRVFPAGMADVVPIAHPRWKLLPEADKERYEAMAKEHKKRMRGQVGDAIRQDNQGNIIALRKDAQSEYEKAREREILQYKNKFPSGDDLLDFKFHFIHVQSLCKTEDNQYLPVEMGLSEFSFRNGVSKVLHQFLKPGAIPTGMRYSCQRDSDDTHQIPCSGHERASDNWIGLQNTLENFVNKNRQLNYFPPLFAMREEWDRCDFTSDYIYEHSCMRNQAVRIKVYELENLMVSLFEHLSLICPTKGKIADMLTTHSFDYTPNLKCSFHEELECKHCSLLQVKKYGYIFADTFHETLEFDMKPGCHLPDTDKFKNLYTVRSAPEVLHAPAAAPSYQPQHNYANVMYNSPPPNIPAAQVIRPLASFQPAGAPDIDYRSRQEPVNEDIFVSTLTQQELNSQPGHEKQRLRSDRSATWLPPSITPGSRVWSRTTTPAATPRDTPQATPAATPLATPRQSPPRSGPSFDQYYHQHKSGSNTHTPPRSAPPGLANPTSISSTPPGLSNPYGTPRSTHSSQSHTPTGYNSPNRGFDGSQIGAGFGDPQMGAGFGGSSQRGGSRAPPPGAFGGPPSSGAFSGQPQGAGFGGPPQGGVFGGPPQGGVFGGPPQGGVFGGPAQGAVFGGPPQGPGFKGPPSSAGFGDHAYSGGGFGGFGGRNQNPGNLTDDFPSLSISAPTASRGRGRFKL